MTAILPPDGPDIVEFAMSKRFLGKKYLSAPQRAILKAIYGVTMTSEEHEEFLEMTEGRLPRDEGYQESALICGRRSGKSIIASIVATYESARWGPFLAKMLDPGQIAEVILIAQNETGAGKLREYIKGNLQTLEKPEAGEGMEVFATTSGQERAVTGRAIRLTWPIEIVVYPCTKESVRGATGLCAIFDEVAWWKTSEGHYSQDIDVMRSVDPTLATLAALKPKIVMISSPGRKEGLLWERYKKRDKATRTLVVQAPTWKMNPKIEADDPTYFDRKREDDEEAAAREWGAQFSDDADGTIFLPAAIVDQCVSEDRVSSPPRPGLDYIAWMDAAFKHDRFSLGIGHLEAGIGGDPVVHIDHTKHWTPPSVAKGRKARPLNDREVLAELVEEIRQYGCDRVFGDQYADVPMKTTLETYSVTFVESPVSNPEKVEAFRNLRAALNRGQVDLPNDPILIKDLKGLTSKTTSTGTVHIAAPKRRGAYDDAANVCARIVSKLLPRTTGIDIEKLNAGMVPDDDHRRERGIDWVDRDSPREESVYGSYGFDSEIEDVGAGIY